MSTPSVGVVCCALDEEARLPRLLARLAELDVARVVVVDGGSHDGTVAAAERAGATVLSGPRGRGAQLRVGADVLDTDVLWFLHADVVPPRDALVHMRAALAQPGVVGGAFRLHTVDEGDGVPLGRLVRLADLRSRYAKIPYGDQGLFVTRDVYTRVGGMPAIPLFEDVALATAVRRVGRLVTVPAEIVASGRRFTSAPLRALVTMNVLPTLWRLGVPPDTLASLYRATRR